VVFGSLHSILINLGKDVNGKIPFYSASVAFCIEFAKITTSLTLLFIEWLSSTSSTNQQHSTNQLPRTAIFLFMVPALLYAVVNNLVTHAQKFMDPASFQLLNNLKIVSTAFLYKLIIKKEITSRKWMAIFLLFIGGSVNSMRGLVKTEEKHTNELKSYITTTGLLLVLIYCGASSLAGVYTEAVLKKYRTTSINLQNSVLYTFGLLANVCVFLFSSNDQNKPITITGFFDGFSIYTWLIVLTQVCRRKTSKLMDE
uniref:Uncharacterized protein n=1 Tax=Clytia hemisphaerica TaxID=252671 RepID=A0A7M5X6S2_9CNID